jgi:hypothetical protein
VRDVGEGSSDEEGRGRKNEDTDARRRKRKGEVRTFWSIRKKKSNLGLFYRKWQISNLLIYSGINLNVKFGMVIFKFSNFRVAKN